MRRAVLVMVALATIALVSGKASAATVAGNFLLDQGESPGSLFGWATESQQ